MGFFVNRGGKGVEKMVEKPDIGKSDNDEGQLSVFEELEFLAIEIGRVLEDIEEKNYELATENLKEIAKKIAELVDS
jgi:hypothetical protein